jgi:hypothetical protein
MRGPIFHDAVGPDHHREQIIEAKRRRDIQPVIGFEPDANCVDERGVSLQRLVGSRQRRIWRTKMTFEPKMDAGLIAHFDWAHTAGCRRRNPADDSVFGFPRKIVTREVNHVVILYAGTTRPTGEDIPDGLVETSRDQSPLREADRAKAHEKAHQIGIGTDDLLEVAALPLVLLSSIGRGDDRGHCD